MTTYKLNQTGYILDHKGQIESLTYREYLERFGSDETTTLIGVAPRLYVNGNTIMSWGVRGNNHHFYASFKNKNEAKNALYEIWESNLNDNCEYVYFAKTKKELFDYLAESYNKEPKVIKRYFKIQDAIIEKTRLSKIKHDARPIFTKEMMVDYINSNKETIKNSLIELDELKKAENKPEWQVKANALIQKVSNNDFRVLNWKEIYNLIRDNA